MITQQDVIKRLTLFNLPACIPYAPFMAQVANVFVTHDPACEDNFITVGVHEAARDALGATTGTPPDTFEHAFVMALFTFADNWYVENVATAKQAILATVAIPLPTVQAPPDDNVIFAAEKQRLADMRKVPGVVTRGDQLADAALRMDGWFTWVRSGPLDPKQPGHVRGQKYGIKAEWDHSATDRVSTPWEQHNQLRNDFGDWMLGGPPPSPKAHMNCWEAVMYAAERAGLVTEQALQIMHRRAAVSYEMAARPNKHKPKPKKSDIAAATHYNLSLSHAFQFFSSVPYKPSAGLIPMRGEVMFWDRDTHVAISLGPGVDRKGKPTHWIMSNWCLPRNGFHRIELDDLSHMSTNFRFRPCPF